MEHSQDPKPVAPAGWLPIETAPKDGKCVLVFSANRFVVEAWFSQEWGQWVQSDVGGTNLLKPSHWMPRPEAPGAAAPTFPQAAAQEAPAAERVTDAMVSRFLGWPLPKTFSPDCGISFDGRKDDQWNKNKTWPIGTNLFTATETRQMLEYVLSDPDLRVQVKQADERGDMAMREWHRECDDGDELLRLLGLDPSACRTDGGSINMPKVRAALSTPAAQEAPAGWRPCINCGVDSTGKMTHSFGCSNDQNVFRPAPAAPAIPQEAPAEVALDAARYRWLRDQALTETNFDHTTGDNFVAIYVPFDGFDEPNLDDSIDRALAPHDNTRP